VIASDVVAKYFCTNDTINAHHSLSQRLGILQLLITFKKLHYNRTSVTVN